MRVLLFCASQLAMIDVHTNSFSIIFVAEEFPVVGFTAVIPQISVSALVAREATEPDQQAGLLHFRLNDQLIVTQPTNFNFQGRLRLRAINVLQGLVISSPGTLTCSLTIGDAVLASWDI